MPTIIRHGQEFYIPDADDLAEMNSNPQTNQHSLDCGCEMCQMAQNNRHGCYHNGVEWTPIL
jgi:hypothetical protein